MRKITPIGRLAVEKSQSVSGRRFSARILRKHSITSKTLRWNKELQNFALWKVTRFCTGIPTIWCTHRVEWNRDETSIKHERTRAPFFVVLLRFLSVVPPSWTWKLDESSRQPNPTCPIRRSRRSSFLLTDCRFIFISRLLSRKGRRQLDVCSWTHG